MKFLPSAGFLSASFLSMQVGAADGSRTRTPIRTQAPQACQSTNSSTAANCGLFTDRLAIIPSLHGFVNENFRIYERKNLKISIQALDIESVR